MIEMSCIGALGVIVLVQMLACLATGNWRGLGIGVMVTSVLIVWAYLMDKAERRY